MIKRPLGCKLTLDPCRRRGAASASNVSVDAGTMDLVTGAKRVVVAMQHAAKGKSKVVTKCNMPSSRTIDLVVTDMG